MLKQTALHAEHLRLGAKLVDFAGWDMPIQYASQLDEHHAVRKVAGMFDVAHMSAVDLHGPRTREFLRRLLANDVAKLKAPGKALYSCMLNPQGGVIDDLIVYFMAEDFFRVVVNAATCNPRRASACASHSAQDVLPFVPVTAKTRSRVLGFP
mgnify:CR=1 FL=1